jgi:epoxyqueuosine reductase
MPNPAVPLHVSPPPTERDRLTTEVKRLALECGLTVSAVTTADPFPEALAYIERHIETGHMAGMDWFTAERAGVAADVRQLHDRAVSILSVGIAYWPGPMQKPDDGVLRGRISRYAWGRDYHRVLKRRLATLLERIEHHVGRPVEARNLVDTARIVERAVAERSGLGWFGKHACIIVPGHGSWVLLGELVLDLDLTPDRPLNRNCGSCRICLDRCPTNAIVAPYTVHAPSCISFLTIEERGVIPHHLRAHMGDWVYGCDVCQEVCPYTGAAARADDEELKPASIENAWPDLHRLLTMTEKEFGDTYHGTPLPRTKRRGLARNAAIAFGNVGSEADIPFLAERLANHDEPLVRAHLAWALGNLGATASLRRALATEPDPLVLAELDLALS